MLSKYGNCTRLLKIKNKLKIGCFVGVFYKTIIPLALVGYEMIIAISYPTHTRGIFVNYKLYQIVTLLLTFQNSYWIINLTSSFKPRKILSHLGTIEALVRSM